MHEENKYQKIEILKQRKHNKISESQNCDIFVPVLGFSGLVLHKRERERERDTKNRDGIGQKVRGSLA